MCNFGLYFTKRIEMNRWKEIESIIVIIIDDAAHWKKYDTTINLLCQSEYNSEITNCCITLSSPVCFIN